MGGLTAPQGLTAEVSLPRRVLLPKVSLPHRVLLPGLTAPQGLTAKVSLPRRVLLPKVSRPRRVLQPRSHCPLRSYLCLNLEFVTGHGIIAPSGLTPHLLKFNAGSSPLRNRKYEKDKIQKEMRVLLPGSYSPAGSYCLEIMWSAMFNPMAF